MRIDKAPSTVFTPLDDGRGVLLNLDTLLYYSLNRTGAALWRQIDEAESLSFDDLVHHLCERYEVTEGDARHHLGNFVERLERFKMITIA